MIKILLAKKLSNFTNMVQTVYVTEEYVTRD